MKLNTKQKKYLKKYYRKKSLSQLAVTLELPEENIKAYLQKRLNPEKYQQLVSNKSIETNNPWQARIKQFNFQIWLKQYWWQLLILVLIALASYINGLGSEFLSDDIAAIPQSGILDSWQYIWSHPPAILRPLFYFVINKLFGRIPIPYRLLNLFFHLGTGLLVYLIVWLSATSLPALIASLLFMVHPLQVEAVTWISGGPYSQYTFFMMLALSLYILAQTQTNKKLYLFSIVSFVLSLMSSEKALAFPLILLVFGLSFERLKSSWKKLVPYFVLGGIWVAIYASRIGQRVTELAEKHYQAPTKLNPFFQIPVALSSYLSLIFWPDKLTLYHTELHFSKLEFTLRSGLVLVFLSLIITAFRFSRKIFFWLSFFILALTPTLTPFGISWIVAERYAYPAAIGIYISLGLGLNYLAKKIKSKTPIWVGFFIILTLLSVRTIVRNIDWHNQDNLWLSAAKTSPSSAQNHNNLGDYYARHGDLQKALKQFQVAIDLLPGYADAYHNLANVYWQLKQVDQAIENYQQAIKFNSSLWQSSQNLALIYYQQDQLELAQEYIEKSLMVNPDNAQLLQLLRQITAQ